MGAIMMADKISFGQFYTRGNPFQLAPFLHWAEAIDLASRVILEPFAGANHINQHLQRLGCGEKIHSFDLHPKHHAVRRRDTIKNFPTGYSACVTNPPWLAKNSATRKGIHLPNTEYDNLYKTCLALCLAHCHYVCALVPASFLHSGLFQARLHSYILLHHSLFTDTENPVCLALFNKLPSDEVFIYYDERYIGKLGTLKKELPVLGTQRKINFNAPDGPLGFIACDNTKHASIRFCRGEEIAHDLIKESSRFITRIGGDFIYTERWLAHLNMKINAFRHNTQDLFLTPFRGLRADNMYRRRMDYHLARQLINAK